MTTSAPARLRLSHWLSRYVNKLSRNRPRIIHRRVYSLPPLRSEPHSITLVILCEADKFTDGLWCAWSWMRFLRGKVALHLFVDGVVTGRQRLAFECLFPGAEVSSLPAYLASQPAPSAHFQAFLNGYRYARKLALLLHLQKVGPVLYADSDVLVFRQPDILIAKLEAGKPNAYMADPGARSDQTYVDPWVRAQAEKLGLPCILDFNSGLLWIGQGTLDSTVVERLLTGWHPGVYYHFAEQTILAVLFGVNHAQSLPENDYVLSAEGMHFWERDLPCGELTVRHYMGLVRHRMYSHAYSFLLRGWRKSIRKGVF